MDTPLTPHPILSYEDINDYAEEFLKKHKADVNTVIVLIKRPFERLDDFTIKFIAFKKSFEDVLNAHVVNKIENTAKPTFDNEDFRLYPKTKQELLFEGIEISGGKTELINRTPEDLPYIGNKWGGKYLRAPDIFFTILEKAERYRAFKYEGECVIVKDVTEMIEE